MIYLVKMVGSAQIGGGFFGNRSGTPHFEQWNEGIIGFNEATYIGYRTPPRTETEEFRVQVDGTLGLPTDLVRAVQMQTRLVYKASGFINIQEGGDADCVMRVRPRINGTYLTPWPDQNEFMVDDLVTRTLTWPKYLGLNFSLADANILDVQWQGKTSPNWNQGVSLMFAIAAELWVYYVKIPTLTAIDPIFGTESGGTIVRITGEGFLDEVPGTPDVKFDSISGTSPSVLSDTSMDITTPAHAPGFVNMTVTTNYGTSLTLVNAYEYTADAIPDVQPGEVIDVYL